MTCRVMCHEWIRIMAVNQQRERTPQARPCPNLRTTILSEGCSCDVPRGRSSLPERSPPVAQAGGLPRNDYSVSSLYCFSVKGTTLKRPCRTSGESANRLFALTSASVTGLAKGLPALILTRGVFGSDVSTDTTVAVPTALFSSPVW